MCILRDESEEVGKGEVMEGHMGHSTDSGSRMDKQLLRNDFHRGMT